MRFLLPLLMTAALGVTPALADYQIHATLNDGPHAGDDLIYSSEPFPTEAACKDAVDHQDARLTKSIEQLKEVTHANDVALSCSVAENE